MALQDRGCGFASLNEAINTTSAEGKLVFHIMGALAEFERALIVERTRADMASARMRGRHLRRPRALTGAQLAKAAVEIAADRETVASMAALFGVTDRPCGGRCAIGRRRDLDIGQRRATPRPTMPTGLQKWV